MSRFRSFTLAALIGSAAIGCISLGGPPIEDLVLSAESAGDHSRIAEYYRNEASKARERSAEHRRLAQVYGGRNNWGVAFTNRASDHCIELAMLEDERGAKYELLAVEHEQLAQERSRAP